MIKKILVLILTAGTLSLAGQSIVGKWKTIDDISGKTRSVVEITENDGTLSGKIVKLFRAEGEDQDPACEECSGKRKGQKIIGMEIISDMEYDEDDKEYSGGEILDPETGNVYDCKLWIGEDNNLKVRGYLMFFFRTQTWLPYDE